MGGRGSNQGYGGSRRARRTGGVTKRQIGNVYDMMDTAQYDQFIGADSKLIAPMEVFLVGGKYAKEYGEVIDQLQWAEMEGTGVGGYFDGRNIAINTEFSNPTALNAAYDEGIKNGFHPSRGNKSAMEVVAAHEYAHALTGWAAEKMGIGSRNSISDIYKAADVIVNEARKSLGYKNNIDVSRRISGYAKETTAETIAEAFADVYANGSNASVASRVVVNTLNRHMGGKHTFY